MDWTLWKCEDCGANLDAFGVCGNATADQAIRQAAPVHCGLTPLEAANRAWEMVRSAHKEEAYVN